MLLFNIFYWFHIIGIGYHFRGGILYSEPLPTITWSINTNVEGIFLLFESYFDPPSPFSTHSDTRPMWSIGSIYRRIYNISSEISTLTPLSFTKPLWNIIIFTINMIWYWSGIAWGKLLCPPNVIYWLVCTENIYYNPFSKGLYITLSSSRRPFYSIIGSLYPQKFQLNVKRVLISEIIPWRYASSYIINWVTNAPHFQLSINNN